MKFRYKLTFIMIGLLSIIFGIGESILITTSFNNSLEREKVNSYNSFVTVINTLSFMGEYNGYDDIESVVKQIAERNIADLSAVRITSSEGPVYFDGTAEFEDVSDKIGSSNCVMSLIGGKNNKHFLQLSGFVPYGAQAMFIDIAYDISSIYETRETQQKTYQNIFIVMITICAVLSYLLSWLMTRPLSTLSNATRDIASGNLSSRVTVSTNDEVGIVAADFNNMAEKLEENITELKLAMERQENFMGSFAHELKTPMTSIIGYADLIRTGTLDANEQTQAANYIFSEGKRLENLSFKLLDILIMKKNEVKLIPASPSQIVINLAEHLKYVYQSRNILLQYKCMEGFCLLEPDLVKSLLVNLIDNARKALEHGGNIFVTCEMTGYGCRLRVFDNGKGIPQKSLEHLTEAFYRVDKSRARAQGGVGLGLTLCNEIVQLHNGEISFQSREGNGTTVTVELRGGRA